MMDALSVEESREAHCTYVLPLHLRTYLISGDSGISIELNPHGPSY